MLLFNQLKVLCQQHQQQLCSSYTTLHCQSAAVECLFTSWWLAACLSLAAVRARVTACYRRCCSRCEIGESGSCASALAEICLGARGRWRWGRCLAPFEGPNGCRTGIFCGRWWAAQNRPWIGTGVERGSTGGLAAVECAWGGAVVAWEGVKSDRRPPKSRIY